VTFALDWLADLYPVKHLSWHCTKLQQPNTTVACDCVRESTVRSRSGAALAVPVAPRPVCPKDRTCQGEAHIRRRAPFRMYPRRV
jgi:hypothetical protein